MKGITVKRDTHQNHCQDHFPTKKYATEIIDPCSHLDKHKHTNIQDSIITHPQPSPTANSSNSKNNIREQHQIIISVPPNKTATTRSSSDRDGNGHLKREQGKLESQFGPTLKKRGNKGEK